MKSKHLIKYTITTKPFFDFVLGQNMFRIDAFDNLKEKYYFKYRSMVFLDNGIPLIYKKF